MQTKMNPVSPPPADAERLLELVLAEPDREPVLGDFAEEFYARGATGRARRWYRLAALRSAPSLLYLNLKQDLTWRTIMDNLAITKRDNRWAVIGFALLLPAVLLIAGGALFSLGLPTLNDLYDRLGLVNTLFHPAVIIGGILVAIGSNVFRVFGFDLRKEDGNLVSTVVIRGKALNLALVVLCALLAAALLLYGFVENYALVMTHP